MELAVAMDRRDEAGIRLPDAGDGHFDLFAAAMEVPDESGLTGCHRARHYLRGRARLRIISDQGMIPKSIQGDTMARRWQVVLMVLALVIVAWRAGQAQSQVAQFRIVVEPTAAGLKAACISGCAWKELSFGCDKGRPCKAEIDQLGVGPSAK